jgi:branched-chain amino acid transport system substrate-binding protein
LRFAGSFGYDFRTVDVRVLVRRIAAARPDVLFVSAYLEDAIALRRELVRQDVPLVANIGTSSSYCMPAFGQTLGEQAVGVFASDKPSATSIDPDGLRPAAAALLARANAAYRERWGADMSPAALAGFSAAWALFADVLRAAPSLAPADVAAAAREVDLPPGSLPNGSGLRFGTRGTPDAGDNLAAASVIWEWVAPGQAAVIWPPAFASDPIDPTTYDDAW